jgi:hypothetical protein
MNSRTDCGSGYAAVRAVELPGDLLILEWWLNALLFFQYDAERELVLVCLGWSTILV